MKILRSLLVVVFVLSVFVTVALTQTPRTPIEGRKVVVKDGDTAWRFSAHAFDDGFKWGLIVAANPFLQQPGRLFYNEKDEPIVIIHAGEELIIPNKAPQPVRQSISELVPAPLPPPVPGFFDHGLGYSIAVGGTSLVGLLLLAGLLLLVLVLIERNRRRKRLNANPIDPVYQARPMRTDFRRHLGLDAPPQQVMNTIASYITDGFDEIASVLVYGGIWPTMYGDNIVRDAEARGDTLYVGVRYDSAGHIVGYALAWAGCLNRSSQFSPIQARTLLQAHPRFEGAKRYRTRPGFSRPFIWSDIERYLMGQFAQQANPAPQTSSTPATDSVSTPPVVSETHVPASTPTTEVLPATATVAVSTPPPAPPQVVAGTQPATMLVPDMHIGDKVVGIHIGGHTIHIPRTVGIVVSQQGIFIGDGDISITSQALAQEKSNVIEMPPAKATGTEQK